ncbi:MAG: hypothetical protein KJ621_17310 [Proteobacteria bacterium]|nr:hypothetical protein [Pseudomonadota bacterium]
MSPVDSPICPGCGGSEWLTIDPDSRRRQCAYCRREMVLGPATDLAGVLSGIGRGEPSARSDVAGLRTEAEQAEQERDWATAAARWNKVLGIRPGDHQARERRDLARAGELADKARELLSRQRADEAADLLAEALELDPRSNDLQRLWRQARPRVRGKLFAAWRIELIWFGASLAAAVALLAVIDLSTGQSLGQALGRSLGGLIGRPSWYQVYGLALVMYGGRLACRACYLWVSGR